MTTKLMNLQKLENVARHVFAGEYRNRTGNEFSPISGIIMIESQNVMMQDIRDLEYYGFKTTMISIEGVTDCTIENMRVIPKKILYHIFVYQDQEKEGHELKVRNNEEIL